MRGTHLEKTMKRMKNLSRLNGGGKQHSFRCASTIDFSVDCKEGLTRNRTSKGSLHGRRGVTDGL